MGKSKRKKKLSSSPKEFCHNKEAARLLHRNRINSQDFDIEDSIRLMSHLLYPNDINKADEYFDSYERVFKSIYEHKKIKGFRDENDDKDLEKSRMQNENEYKKEYRNKLSLEGKKEKKGFFGKALEFFKSLNLNVSDDSSISSNSKGNNMKGFEGLFVEFCGASFSSKGSLLIANSENLLPEKTGKKKQ
jgi:hypothetical protein